MEGEYLVKYQFLKESREYIKQIGVSLEDFEKPHYKEKFNKSIIRINSLNGDGRECTPNLSDVTGEILISVIIRILLKLINNNRLTKKYALDESKRIELYLKEDIDKEIGGIVIERLYGEVIERKGKNYQIPIALYLKHSKQFNEKEWKLVNRTVDAGNVLLLKGEMVRLLRREIMDYYVNLIKKIPVKDIPKIFHESKDKIDIEEDDFIISGEYPPCIKHAISILEAGDNLSHNGRVLLATYLFSRNLDIDDIIAYFKGAPDFKESTTRYQLEQLKGERGSGIEYKVPSCSNLQTKGLCYKTDECGRIVNPIQFGSRRK